MSTPATNPHARLMNRLYGVTRFFYDFTRKYYLFGRDTLLSQLPVAPQNHVAEIGCGTARNLVLLARRHPGAHFYGIDAASLMLQTAHRKIARHRLEQRIHLRCAMAEDLDARDFFGLPAFDHIFFSYSLSMISNWTLAIQVALANLKPAGELWIVDFWDLAGYPAPCAALRKSLLAFAHVHHRPELLAHLQALEAQNHGTFTLEPVGRRYAYLARFIKNG